MNHLDAWTGLDFTMKWVIAEDFVGAAHGDDLTYMPMDDRHLLFEHTVIDNA